MGTEGGHLNHYGDGPYWKAVNFSQVGSYSISTETKIEDLDYYLDLAEQRHAWLSVHFHEVKRGNFAGWLDHFLTKDIWIDTFEPLPDICANVVLCGGGPFRRQRWDQTRSNTFARQFDL